MNVIHRFQSVKWCMGVGSLEEMSNACMFKNKQTCKVSPRSISYYEVQKDAEQPQLCLASVETEGLN